jgi:hypothetical protein
LCSLTNGIKQVGADGWRRWRQNVLASNVFHISALRFYETLSLRQTLAELGSSFARKGWHNGRYCCPNLKVKVLTNFGKIYPVTHFMKLFMYGSMDKERASGGRRGGGRNVHTRASQISFGCHIVSFFCPQACISRRPWLPKDSKHRRVQCIGRYCSFKSYMLLAALIVLLSCLFKNTARPHCAYSI